MAALALTIASYVCLTGYDLLAVRSLGIRLPYRRAALAAVIAYGLGHNLSIGALTSAAARQRVYSRDGLSVRDVAGIAVFCGVTTAMGVATLAGLSLLIHPSSSQLLLGTQAAWLRVIGAALLASVALYLLWAIRGERPVELFRVQLRPAGMRVALAQWIVAGADFAFAAAALWVLLPDDSRLGLAPFMGLYAIAVIAGLISQVPGGLGVFEAVLLAGLGSVPSGALLGTLLVYRLIYYVLPLIVAAALLVLTEFGKPLQIVGRASRIAGLYLAPVAPQLSAGLVFLCGAILLLSGATPAIDARMVELRHWVPLPLLELSHLTASVAGLALLVLARGLLRRLSAAYQLTFWLLVVGTIASLVKGLDFEEALLLAAVACIVWLGREAFYRSSSLIRERFSPGWMLSVAAVVALTVLIATLDRRVPYSNELWWTFGHAADAPRELRATLAVLVLSGALFAANLLRPARVHRHDPRAVDIERARRGVALSTQSLANAALSADKRLLFHAHHDAFVMYQVMGQSWIALGDPVGPRQCVADLARRYCEHVDRAGGRPVFYEVSTEHLPVYIDLGLSLVKLGEEARVPLHQFSLEGSQRAELRQARRRAQRQGASFEVLAPHEVPAHLHALERISDSWLAAKATAEKRFSVGRFSPQYLRQFPIDVVRVQGEPVAFANVWG